MTLPDRCHPPCHVPRHRSPAVFACIAAISRVRPPGALEDRIQRLNRERPHSLRFAAPWGRSRFNRAGLQTASLS
jgi:hypothetical protein